jgi:hypothetical protein
MEVTLIAGHSDDLLNFQKQSVAYIKGFKKIFGVNLKQFGSFSSPLPLGLTNQTNETPAHLIFGNTDVLRLARQHVASKDSFDNSVYANFSEQTNLRVRLPLKKLLHENSMPFDDFEVSLDARLKYLKGIRNSNFTLCPEGNGIDTHRIWEALYMESIPIIKSNRVLNPLVANLPVLVIDEWTQILDTDYLESKWHSIRGKIFSTQGISANYWEKVFLKTHS